MTFRIAFAGIGNNSFRTRLVELLTAANETIDLLMWQFTDHDLAQLLVSLAESNVRVRLVIEDQFAESEESVVRLLRRSSKIEVLTDAFRTPMIANYRLSTPDNALSSFAEKQPSGPHAGAGPATKKDFNPYLHQHVAIIDNKIVAAGSSNWSHAGFFSNDEANIVTTVDWLVHEFRRSFEQTREQAAAFSPPTPN